MPPEIQARIREAATNTELEPWQRDFMRGLGNSARSTEARGKFPSSAQPSPSELAATSGTWTELNPGSIRLAYATAIYDPVRTRMLLFGGHNGARASDEVWVLSLSGSPTWSQLAVAGPRPPGVFVHSAIYDPARDRMIIYGGSTDVGPSEVWALSLAGTPAWAQITPTGTPPDPRSSHSAIYDPVRDRMIVFGGIVGTTVNEVWALSLSGGPAWTQLTPSGSPPGRAYHTAIYDPVRDQMVVFGGFTFSPSFASFDDVWALSLASLEWTQLTASGTAPGARYGSQAIYDPVADQMIVQGGFGNFGLTAAVFSLALSTSTWTQITPSGASPPRFLHSSIYDPLGQRLIVMGGHDGRYMKDVFALSLSGAPEWTELPTILPPGAGGRGYDPLVIDDPVRDRLLVFGGIDETYSYPSNLWGLSLSGTPSWTEISPSGTPPAGRQNATAIYDAPRDRMVVFGGVSGEYYNDVWELSLSGTPLWTQLAPSGTAPDPRFLHSAIFDPVRERMIVFGGYDDASVVQGDVWTLSLSGAPAWAQLAPTGTPPSPTTYHSAIYDPVRDRMLVCGGFDGIAVHDADVWELSLSGTPAWAQLAPSGPSPGYRLDHTAIYDPPRDRMVIFGGYTDVGTANDAWELSLAGTPTWSQLTPDGDLPESRTGAAAIYDSARERMVVFGGINPSGIPLEDARALEFAAAAAPENPVTPVSPTACVTPDDPCVAVPVNIARTTADGLRAFSVDIQLSAGLTLCASVDEGTYLNSVGGTQFQVLSNGGGSYTIDCSILGVPCGATAATGSLFTLQLGSSLPSATGTVTVTSVTLRDCANGTVLGSAGAPASISIDNEDPAAITMLNATQQLAGNDADGTTKIIVSWPAVEAGASVLVYRKGFGFHPEYDDAGGSAPAPPSYPPAGWTLAGTVNGPLSFADEPTVRDFYYYVAFVSDACGNVSPVSNRTGGTLDYHLGDVQPAALVRGDNLVNTPDLSDLGLNYGALLTFNDPLNYLDVGPTTDFSAGARPTTDNRVQFEDLMMFAINYGQVGAPVLAAKPAGPEGSEQFELQVPELPAVGETFAASLLLSSPGTVKGVSVQLAYDPAVVEAMGVEAGELLTGQHVTSVVLSSGPGDVDAALLGAGETISGHGEVARALFRVRSRGDAAIRVSSMLARDKHNRALTLGAQTTPAGSTPPARTALGMAFPNPFQHETTFELALRHEAHVSLDVYDLTGRRVASVLQGTQPAGLRLVKWDGRSERGARLAPGIYLMQLDADGQRQTRRVLLVP